MKTSKEIANEINSMSPEDAETSGAKLIELYAANRSSLKIIDLADRIEPFLSDKVKAFWKVPPPFASDDNFGCGKDEEGVPHICFMQLVCSKPIPRNLHSDEAVEVVTDADLKKFANFINMAADKGLIHSGALCPIGGLELAVVSPVKRTALYFYPVTTMLNADLIKMSKLFTMEGQLGYEEDQITL